MLKAPLRGVKSRIEETGFIVACQCNFFPERLAPLMTIFTGVVVLFLDGPAAEGVFCLHQIYEIIIGYESFSSNFGAGLVIQLYIYPQNHQHRDQYQPASKLNSHSIMYQLDEKITISRALPQHCHPDHFLHVLPGVVLQSQDPWCSFSRMNVHSLIDDCLITDSLDFQTVIGDWEFEFFQIEKDLREEYGIDRTSEDLSSDPKGHFCRICFKQFEKAQSLGGHMSKIHPNSTSKPDQPSTARKRTKSKKIRKERPIVDLRGMFILDSDEIARDF